MIMRNVASRVENWKKTEYEDYQKEYYLIVNSFSTCFFGGMGERITQREQERNAINTEITKLEKQLANAKTLAYKGIIQPEEYEKDRHKITQEKQTLLKKIPRQENQKTNAMEQTLDQLAQLLRIARLSYKMLPPHQKLQFIRKFVSNIIVSSKNIDIKPSKEIKTLFDIQKFRLAGNPALLPNLIHNFHHITIFTKSLKDILTKEVTQSHYACAKF